MLDFIKKHLRIDHNTFDDNLQLLIEACKSSLILSGITYDENSELQKIITAHFVAVNFKNGAVNETDNYTFPPVYYHLVEQARYENE